MYSLVYDICYIYMYSIRSSPYDILYTERGREEEERGREIDMLYSILCTLYSIPYAMLQNTARHHRQEKHGMCSAQGVAEMRSRCVEPEMETCPGPADPISRMMSNLYV